MYERKKLSELLGQEPSFPNGINGTFELAINVGPPEQVDIKFKKMIDAGAKPIYKPRNEPWKMRSSMVADPGRVHEQLIQFKYYKCNSLF